MKSTRVFQVLALVVVAAAVVVTLGPPRLRPQSGLDRSVEHVLAFAVTGLAVALAYPKRWLMLMLGRVLATGALEILQAWLPRRHAYFGDFILNAAGLCAGALF